MWRNSRIVYKPLWTKALKCNAREAKEAVRIVVLAIDVVVLEITIKTYA